MSSFGTAAPYLCTVKHYKRKIMLRGTTTFVCKDCGHTFKGMDIEDNATIYSMPMKCPKCGSMHTKVYASPGMLIDPAPDPLEPLKYKVMHWVRKIMRG